MQAAVGFSDAADTGSAVDEALSAVDRVLRGKPDLVVLFATSDHAEDIRRAAVQISAHFEAPALLGGSTTGVITAEGEHEDAPGLGVLALKGGRATAILAASDEQVGTFLDSLPPQALGLALLDPRRQDPRALERVRRHRGMLVGAGISGRGESLFGLAGTSSGEGQVGLASLEGVALQVGVTNGVTAATPFYSITQARHRAVLELDGRPAGRVFGEFIQGQDLARADQLPGLLMAVLRRGPDGEPITRPIVGLDARAGALVFQQDVEPGQELAFAWRETLGAIRDRAQVLKAVVGRLHGPAAAALYFNCQGRGQSLFLEPNSDLEAIRLALPGVPLLGMSSSFELAPGEGRTELHMYAGVLAVLGSTR